MRFVCDSCRAQYMISDDKVGAKGVKVRCKKCGYVILVRKAAEAAPPPPPPPEALGDAQDGQETQVMDNPLGLVTQEVRKQNFDPDVTTPGTQMPGAKAKSTNGTNGSHPNPFLSQVPDDEISSVFDQVLNSGHHKIPEGGAFGEALGDGSDDRMSTRVLDAEVVRKLAEEAGANGTAKNGSAKNGESVSYDWFVAVDEKQVGPLNVDKIKAMWDRGEISPDSLCWRAGFSDWTALSEVQDLASVLAPKPQKPVIMAPSPMAGAVVTVPVESAFSAGGVTRTVRSEVPMLAAAPGTQEETGWKPSAASALQSLVKEEIEALTKPSSPKVQSSERMVIDEKPRGQPLGGLLDVPEVSQPRANGKAASNGAEVMNPMASAYSPQPYQAQYPPYRPEEGSARKWIVIAGVAGGVLVLALAVLITILAVGNKNNPQQQTPVARNDTHVAVPPTTVTVTPPVQPPAPTTAVAPKVDDKAAPKAPLVATAPTTGIQPNANPPARSEPRRENRQATNSTPREPRAVATREEPPTPKRQEGKEPDDFEKEFGTGKKTNKVEAPPAEEPKKTRTTVYIPPAPGSGGDLPDVLGQGDIMQTVLQQKPAIVDCVKKQKAKDADSSGTLVMKWTIQPSGKTAGVQVVTDEFKSTYLAGCMTGLIKNWSFPRHKNPQDPISFPFKF